MDRNEGFKNNYYKNFHYKGLEINLHKEVYEPAEDTFQLLDSIEIKSTDFVLEIGTGSGIIGLYCAKTGAKVICSDINPFAIQTAKYNFIKNQERIKGKFEIRKGNLFSIVKSNETFDVIIFNPPYLPTKKEDRIDNDKWHEKAIDGGKDGLHTTTRFIKELPNHLSKNGKSYLISSSFTKKEKIEKVIDQCTLCFEVISSIWYGDERLDVFKVMFKC